MSGHALKPVSKVGGAAMANAAATAALGVICARFLGPAGQGHLTLVVTVVAFISVVCGMGSGTSLRLRAHVVPDLADVRAYVALTAALMPVAAALTLAAVLVLSPSGSERSTLALSGILGAVCVASRQSSEVMQAYGHTSRSILGLALASAAQAVVFAMFVFGGQGTLNTALLAAVAGASCHIAYAAYVLKDSVDRPVWAWDFRRTHQMFRQGISTLGFSVGLLAMHRTDRLLLVVIAGPTAGGLYAVAATVGEAARITSSAVGQLLFVRVSATRSVTEDAMKIYRLAIGAQLLCSIVLAVAATDIVDLLFGSAYASAVPLLRVLLIAEFFMGLALMDSRMLMGLGKLAAVGKRTTLVVAGAVPLYAALITPWTATGAVIVTVAVYGVYSASLIHARLGVSRSLIGASAGPA